jgi:hypothetical protein
MRTVPCVCLDADPSYECYRCKGKRTVELAENAFEWRGDYDRQGKITVGVDGSLFFEPDDPHYRGTMSREEALLLATRILELQGENTR